MTYWMGLLTGVFVSMFLVSLLMDRVSCWIRELKGMLEDIRDNSKMGR